MYLFLSRILAASALRQRTFDRRSRREARCNSVDFDDGDRISPSLGGSDGVKTTGEYSSIWMWVKMEDLGDHRC